MQEEFERTALLLGEDAIPSLQNSTVAVFGLGGVGSYVCEALARAGVGSLVLVDNDTVSKSNINRQLYALHSTVGRLKTEVAKERILDIQPGCSVKTYPLFFLPETADQIDFSCFDYVVDAIDTVSGKLCIIKKACSMGIPVISCMGTGNKLHPELLEIAELSETSVCPLARVMRRECKALQLKHIKVVYSKEPPLSSGSGVPGSVSFVPSAAGLLLASEVIRHITSK